MGQELKPVYMNGVLDLSLNRLSELTEAHMKEITSLRKVHTLDLSDNNLETLPESFSSLTNIYTLDLSKNKLKSLPASIGSLKQLKRLDLWNNNLTTLPLSFCELRNLKWLDLKDNPLEPKLKEKAGNCLDDKECQECAKKVVDHIKVLSLEKEKQQEKVKEREREKEALKRILELTMKEKQKQERKAKKEKQKQEKAKTLKDQENTKEFPSYSDFNDEVVPQKKNGAHKPSNKKAKKAPKQNKFSCMKLLGCIFLTLLCVALMSISVLSLYTNGDLTVENAIDALPLIKSDLMILMSDSYTWIETLVQSGLSNLEKRDITWKSIVKSLQEMTLSIYSGVSKSTAFLIERAPKHLSAVYDCLKTQGLLYMETAKKSLFGHK